VRLTAFKWGYFLIGVELWVDVALTILNRYTAKLQAGDYVDTQ